MKTKERKLRAIYPVELRAALCAKVRTAIEGYAADHPGIDVDREYGRLMVEQDRFWVDETDNVLCQIFVEMDQQGSVVPAPARRDSVRKRKLGNLAGTLWALSRAIPALLSSDENPEVAFRLRSYEADELEQEQARDEARKAAEAERMIRELKEAGVLADQWARLSPEGRGLERAASVVGRRERKWTAEEVIALQLALTREERLTPSRLGPDAPDWARARLGLPMEAQPATPVAEQSAAATERN